MRRVSGLVLGLQLALVAPCFADSLEAEHCEYRKAYVEPQSARVGSPETGALEPLRQRILASWARAAREVGLELSRDRDGAWLRLQVTAMFSDAGDPYIRFDLTPYLKLQHHLFIAVMDDPEFPSGGRLGSSYGVELNPFPPEHELEQTIRVAMRVVWSRASQEIEALCALRARLIDEGWTELEELRKQLILDMERVRAARRRDTQRKRLKLQIESAD